MFEIERKFFVKQLPDLTGYKMSIIKQSYLNNLEDFNEIRLRNYDDQRYYLDFKSKGKLERKENGIKMTKEQYDQLNQSTEYIVKKRYYLQNRTFVDIYCEDLEGLIVVEVEFDSVEEANKYIIPEWFGRELTNEDKYKNRNLVGKKFVNAYGKI